MAIGWALRRGLRMSVPLSASSSPLGPVAEGMRAKLEAGLRPVSLAIVDDSAKHAGHAGVRDANPALGGETHFNIKVVSSVFEDKPLIARHRMVYALLDDDIKAGVHALKLKTMTPKEAGVD